MVGKNLAVEFLIQDEISVRELTALLKKKSLQFHISYGSGGFCCSVIDLTANHFVGYSYDIIEAIRSAFEKYDECRSKNTLRPEEPTVPDVLLSDLLASIKNK